MTATSPPSTRDRLLDVAEELVLRSGFAATTVDAILGATGASKGAFFHHFPSKRALGTALVERYARADAEILETFMTRAEAAYDDPADQLIEFVAAFERAVDETAGSRPGCLFVSFIYEQAIDDQATHELIVESIELWRSRILDKLESAAEIHPPAVAVDLPSLADQVFTIFEGGFILARATGDPERVGAQLSHLRSYLVLLFGRERPPA